MLHKKLAKYVYIVTCILFLQTNSYAQEKIYLNQSDTLKLTFKQAEQLFLDSNLQLLAQHYNILSSKALVEQARKWDNPQLSTNQNLWNNDEGFFKHGTTYDQGVATPVGEIYADVEQIIRTAGKRKRQVDIAKTNVNIAETQFNATMRALRLTLITDFNTIAQLEGNAELYKDNMERLTKLDKAMEQQLKSGDIARKEYIRIQALIVGLKQNMTDNANSIEQAESELKTILRMKGNVYIKPVLPESDLAIVLPDISIPALIDSAKHNNTDYQAEVYQLQLQRQTLRLQKALAIPDVTVGVDMDQHSTYVPYYTGLNIGLPLPIWDRNQGNIKSARNLVKAEEANMQQLDIKLENDVMNAYKKLLNEIRLNTGSNKTFYKDYYELYKNILEAFNNRQIGMLEFLDYFNDYVNTRQQQLQQTFNLQMARTDLNDVIGIDIVK